jgi:hypothetical protein
MASEGEEEKETPRTDHVYAEYLVRSEKKSNANHRIFLHEP